MAYLKRRRDKMNTMASTAIESNLATAVNMGPEVLICLASQGAASTKRNNSSSSSLNYRIIELANDRNEHA
jgi:hypothetical protein